MALRVDQGQKGLGTGTRAKSWLEKYLGALEMKGSGKRYQSAILGNQRKHQELLTGTSAADLSLPIPCQLSYLSPRMQRRSSSCRRYLRRAVQTYCIGSRLCHQVCQNGFCRSTVHWFLSQWTQNRTERQHKTHVQHEESQSCRKNKCKACVHTAKLFSLLL